MSLLEQQLLNLVKSNPEIGRELGRILSKHEPPKPQHGGKVSPTSEAKVSFDIPPIPDDFKTIEPGTNLWIRFWKANPDLQESMLKWKSELLGESQYASTRS